jgi:hypothetical protein
MTTTGTAKASATWNGRTYDLGNTGAQFTTASFHTFPGDDRPVIKVHRTEAAAAKARFCPTSTNAGTAPINR